MRRHANTGVRIALAASLTAACSGPSKAPPYDPNHPPEPAPICTVLPAFNIYYRIFMQDPEAGQPLSPPEEQAAIGAAALRLLTLYPTPADWAKSPQYVGNVTAYLTPEDLKMQDENPFAYPNLGDKTHEVGQGVMDAVHDKMPEVPANKWRLERKFTANYPVGVAPPTDKVASVGITLYNPNCTPSY